MRFTIGALGLVSSVQKKPDHQNQNQANGNNLMVPQRSTIDPSTIQKSKRQVVSRVNRNNKKKPNVNNKKAENNKKEVDIDK